LERRDMTHPLQQDAPQLDAATLLGPVARLTVVDAVADRLRGEILAGRLEPGSRLPSERELALALGVNRLTLRAALGRLEALGLIVTRHGAGTVVASWRERAGLDALPALANMLSPRDEAWHELLVSILEVRRVLAAEAVALAAVRHSPYDALMMRERAEEQRARIHDPIGMARGDVAFMRAVVRAARNVGLELILNTFARFPDEHPSLIAALYDEPERTLESYPLVITLIEQRDPDAARELVRKALEEIDRNLVSRARQRAGLLETTQPKPERTPHRSHGSKSPKRAKR
jgi:GntR family transcriptional regulator, transcriptional repressor for pyruvate dehydrogenase complex